MNDFWRADVAGLYAVRNEGDLERDPGTAEPIKLIELSIAAADDRPVGYIEEFSHRSAKAGYWYRALRFADEDGTDPERFAALAYPDSLGAGKEMFIISNDNVVYRKKFGPETLPEVFSADLDAEGWSKLD